MQLLVGHPEELPVIHVVHREPTYLAPKVESPAPVAPYRQPSNDFVEGSSTAQGRTNHYNEHPAITFSSERDNPFNDPPDYEDAAMPTLQETSQTPVVDTYMAPPPVAESSTISNPFSDSHRFHGPGPPIPLGAQGYNASIQSTFDFYVDPLEELHEMEDLRLDIADMRLQRTSFRSDTEYPEYIRDTLAYVSNSPPARQNYYPLWNHVLEYWFPPTEGFDIIQDWDPRTSLSARQSQNNTENDEPLAMPKPSFAVFDIISSAQPFLCVNVHNALPVNEFTKAQARVTLEETFETLKMCSSGTNSRPLCIVSALGAKWGMVVREPNWSQSDLGLEIGSDCVGEWEEDVTSPESFRVMGYCFEEMKKGA